MNLRFPAAILASAQCKDPFACTLLVQVLERILAVDFRFPGSIPVSAECKNLLSRILVADPAKRASIEEIQQHPWCAPQPWRLRQPGRLVPVPHMLH